MTSERFAVGVCIALAALAGIVLLSTVGVWMFVLVALGAVTLFVRAIPTWVVQFVAKAVAIGTILPAIGLIAFNGGWVSAAIAVGIVWVANFLTWAVLGRTHFMAEVQHEIDATGRAHPLAARGFTLGVHAVVYSIALFAASFVSSDIVLVGFFSTILAGGALGLIDAVLRR